MKPSRVFLVSFSDISQVTRYDSERWGEYWHFTTLSCRKLFTEVFPEKLSWRSLGWGLRTLDCCGY